MNNSLIHHIGLRKKLLPIYPLFLSWFARWYEIVTRRTTHLFGPEKYKSSLNVLWVYIHWIILCTNLTRAWHDIYHWFNMWYLSNPNYGKGLSCILIAHGDVKTWKRFPHYWSQMNSPHKKPVMWNIGVVLLLPSTTCKTKLSICRGFEMPLRSYDVTMIGLVLVHLIKCPWFYDHPR